MAHGGTSVFAAADMESVAEAADRLNVSKTYLYKLIRQGKLAAWVVGGKLIVVKADIDKLKKAS